MRVGNVVECLAQSAWNTYDAAAVDRLESGSQVKFNLKTCSMYRRGNDRCKKLIYAPKSHSRCLGKIGPPDPLNVNGAAWSTDWENEAACW